MSPRSTANPYKDLASAILYRAIMDWKYHRDRDVEFFQSDWFEDLCSLSFVDPFIIREKLEINHPIRYIKKEIQNADEL